MLALLFYPIPFQWFNMKSIDLPVITSIKMSKVLPEKGKKGVSYLNTLGKYMLAYKS